MAYAEFTANHKPEKIMFTKCVAAALFTLTLGTISAEASERGTLKNTTDRTITYQVGYANPQGFVSWQTSAGPPAIVPRRRKRRCEW